MSRRYPDLDPPFLPSHYLVVDLEATCDARDFAREDVETIEIGAVVVDADTLAISGVVHTDVRPVVRPRLTSFCIELTRITQDRVDAAPGYPAALGVLTAAAAALPKPLFCSWGGFDHSQLRRDCDRHDLPYPFEAHWNLKSAFTQRARSRVRFGLRRALTHVDLHFEGVQHQAVDDARNAARLLPYCLGRLPVERAGRRRRR